MDHLFNWDCSLFDGCHSGKYSAKNFRFLQQRSNDCQEIPFCTL